MTEKTAPHPAAAAPPAPPQPPAFETVELDTPVMRGTEAISSVQVRKPKAGEMRGLQLQMVAQGDVNAMIALLPRITLPPLMPHEVEALEVQDFGALSGAVMSFFMSRPEREAMAKMFGIQEPAAP